MNTALDPKTLTINGARLWDALMDMAKIEFLTSGKSSYTGWAVFPFPKV